MSELIEYWPGALIMFGLFFGPLIAIKKARTDAATATIVCAITCALFLGLFILGAGLQSPLGYWPSGFFLDANKIAATFGGALGLWILFVVRPRSSNR